MKIVLAGETMRVVLSEAFPVQYIVLESSLAISNYYECEKIFFRRYLCRELYIITQMIF